MTGISRCHCWKYIQYHYTTQDTCQTHCNWMDQSAQVDTLTSKRACIWSKISWSASDAMNVMARPLVPNRPARLHEEISLRFLHFPRVYLPDPMQITIGVRRWVIINDNVNALHIYPSSENIRCYQNSLLKILELLVTRDSRRHVSDNYVHFDAHRPLFLLQAGMNRNARKIAFSQ